MINPCSTLQYYRTSLVYDDFTKQITFVICSFEGYHEIEVILNSLLVQRIPNWNAIVLHDGYNKKFEDIVSKYTSVWKNIIYLYSPTRESKWGHNLRNLAIQHIKTDWVVNTNDDNYYVPIFTEEISKAIKTNPDIIYYPCIHNHPRKDNSNGTDYGLFTPQLKRGFIDFGQFVIKTSDLQQFKINENKPAADGELVDNIVNKYGINIKANYINKCLFVHN